MLDSARSPAESSGFSKKIAATIIIVYTVVTLIPITWIILTGFKSVDGAIALSDKPRALLINFFDMYVRIKKRAV